MSKDLRRKKFAYRAVHTTTKQNFCIDDYLNTTAKRIASFIGSNQTHFYWLRSGANVSGSGLASDVWSNGEFGQDAISGALGVRPAFVLSL